MPRERFQIGDYWLSKRQNSPNWCRTWFDRDTRQTRRVSLGTGDFERAKVLLAQWVTTHGDWSQTGAGDVMLADVFTRYHEQHVRHEVAQPDSQRRSLYIVLEAAPEATVADFGLERQERIVRRLRDAGYRNGTIKRSMAAAHAALNWAWRRELVDRVPPAVTVPEDPPRERVLSVDELAALWDAAAYPHQRMFLLLLVGTAARPGAVLDLTRFQCDLERGLIDLNPSGRAQTAKRRPVVPMAEPLRPWIAACKPGHLVHWQGQAVASMKKSWQRMRAAAGLDDAVVPYVVRHTVASELRARGVPELEIAGMLGHHMPNVRTTGRYAKYSPSYLGEARGALDALLKEWGRAATRPLIWNPVRVRSVADEAQEPNGITAKN